uniref:SFRICE_017985 n=1 Tax=Spodoptera frugiperda TaxID=7108 RepID=A0A2H1W2P0_SPOFR
MKLDVKELVLKHFPYMKPGSNSTNSSTESVFENEIFLYLHIKGTSPSWEQFVRESLVQAAWPVALVAPPRRALTVDHQ